MKREDTIARIREVLSGHGIPRAYLFGSFARRERTYRDIDIAIETPSGRFSLMDLVGIEQEIEDITGKRVDIVVYRSIRPRLKENIKRDLVAVL